MGMNWITTHLSEIAVTPYFFFSNRFFILKNEINQNKDFFEVPLSEFFDITSGYAFKSDDYIENGIKLLRISDFSNHFGIDYSEMVSLPEDYEILFSRFKIEKSDILIAMTGATIGKASIVGVVQEPLLLNQRVGLLRRKDGVQISERVYYHIMKQRALQLQILIKSMGKSQPNVSPFDILKCKVPSIPSNTQFQIEKKIIEVERNIRVLVDRRKEPHKIINEIFAEEFNYSPTLWKEFGKGMTAGTQKSNPKNLTWFSIQSSQIALSNILRFSSRFHNPTTIKLNRILKSLDLWSVEEVIKEIKKGVQPSYNTDGDLKVVKIANMKNGYIDLSEAEFVDEQFYESVKDQAGIDKGDILLCCTGKVSLGKIDYYDLDESTILSVDSYIIRINEVKVHPLFFAYFFRGILGAYQIERDYTGTTNQIHLYNTQIKEFRLPKIEMNSQQKIVDRIKRALDEQKTIERQIGEKQNKISKIIEEAINF
jgi:type I restriction enzyme S subunit